MKQKRFIAVIALMLCVYSSLGAFSVGGVNYSAVGWSAQEPTAVRVTSIAKSAGEHVIIPKTISWWDYDLNKGFQNIPVTEVKLTGKAEYVKTLEAPYVTTFLWGKQGPLLESLVVSNELESIGGLSADNCPALKSIDIYQNGKGLPKSLKGIGSDCFKNQKNLLPGALVLPNLTRVGNGAFLGCTSLKEVDFSDSKGLSEIGFRAFMDSGILNIKLPQGLKIIREEAFRNCVHLCTSSNVTGIIIPQTVEEINPGAFAGCTGLNWIIMTGVTHPYTYTWSSYTGDGLGIFEDCTSLNSIKLSDNLTIISKSMFKGCVKLERILRPGQNYGINFPKSLIKVGENAFEGCISLSSKEIFFPEPIEYVEQCAFKKCTGLVSAVFPHPKKATLRVYYNSFEDCTKLKNVDIYHPDIAEESLPSRSSGYNAGLYFDKNAFKGCTALESMPPAYAYEYGLMPELPISAVKTPLFLEDVTSQTLVECSPFSKIGENVNIKTVYFNRNTKNIGKNVLSGFSNVERIVLMSDFKDSGDDLTTLFPDYPQEENENENANNSFNQTILQIQEGAFAGASKLVNVECNYITPPSIPESAFSDETYLVGKLIVPEESEEDYRNAVGWKNFKIVNDKSAGIDAVNVDNSSEPQYFDLYGRKVLHPSRGMYIMKRGSQVKKVFK